MEHLDVEFWISVGIVFFLLFLSGFFSGSETALTAASKSRMHNLEKEGDKRASVVNKLREKKDRLIGALLLGNNLVNILASAIATSVLIKLVGEAGVVYATLVMTMLVLVFAEVLPKTYALLYSDKMAMAIAPIIRWVVLIFSPVSEAVVRIVYFVLKCFGVDPEKIEESHEEELRGAIELHEGEDEVLEQRAMLRSILDLAEVEVSEIMTHRKNLVMLDADKPVEEIVDEVLTCPHTRLPVYQENQDNIVGVIHAKVLMKELRAHNGDASEFTWVDVASKPWFIPETTPLFAQLQAFRERKEHFAIVVDEFGALEGIVTLEDILEEIVGEIDDEYDIPVPGVKVQPDGSLIVEGTVAVRDLNREYEWNLPDDEDYSTIAGLILYESKMIPQVGQIFSFHGFRFKIMQRQRNQITEVRIYPPIDQAV